MKNPYCQPKELSCFHQVFVSMTMIWIHHDHYPMVKCSVLISHEAPLDVVLTQVASPAPQVELMQCIDSVVLALCCFVLVTKGYHHLGNCRGYRGMDISWTHLLGMVELVQAFCKEWLLPQIGSRIEQLEEQLLPSLHLDCGSL